MANQHAVILCSGGINSTVASALAKEQYAPALLHIAWGHRAAERELMAFEQVAALLKIERTMVAEMSCLAMFGGNARVSRRIALEDAQALGEETPATFVPGLLPSMLSVAASWAGAIGAKKIVLPISENYGVPGPVISDLYPDRRREFVQSFQLMLRYAKPENRELTIETPLLEMTRGEVVRLGERLHIPFAKTWSCYRNDEMPCGRCLPCTTRATGFMQCGTPDPLLVEAAERRKKAQRAKSTRKAKPEMVA